MTLGRINVLALVGDQYKSMVHVVTMRPARLIRAVVWLFAPASAVVSFVLGVELVSVTDLVAALGLLAGVFISAFAVVFSLRVTLKARPTKVLEQNSARLMDESALTVLAAGLFAGLDAIWLAIISATLPEGDLVPAWASAIVAGLSAQVVLYFLLSIRRLHKLYTDTFPPFWTQKKPGDQGQSQDTEARSGSQQR